MADGELSPPIVFAFLVNTCMGIGFLAIPYSTLKFGLLSGLAATLLLGLLAICTGLWIATTLSLTWALVRSKGDPEIAARTPVISSESDVLCKEDRFDIGKSMQMSYVKLVGLLYGDWTQNLLGLVLALVLVTAMWSYAAIFASSMAAIVPAPFLGGTCDVYDDWADSACASRYYLYLAAFAVLMVLLSLVHLREQKTFQVAMTLCRVVLGVAIIGDCLRMLALEEAPPHPASGGGASAHVVPAGEDGATHHYHADRWPSVPSPWRVNLQHGPQHIALATAALTVHMVIPDAVHDLSDKKRYLFPTVGASLAFCAIVYCFVSAAVVQTFGAWTRPVCTLNWVNYTAGRPVAGPLAIALRSFIILMPVFDVMAAYPILAQSLASNLQSVISPETDGRPAWYLRLVCALGPLLGASIVYDAAQTLGWCGILLVPFVFILPQLLLVKAEQLCIKEFGEDSVHTSIYWRWYCDRHVVLGGLFIGSVLTLVSAFSVLSGLA